MRLTLAACATAAALGLFAARRRPATGRGRILRVSRVVADLDRAEEFYAEALGFERAAAGRMDPALAAALRPGQAASVRRLRLNHEEIDLVRWNDGLLPGRPPSRADGLGFQHLAIVVDDMAEAFAHLRQFDPAPISAAPPVALPGGIVAWKFHDPDGHPLELIFFPPGTGRAVWQSDLPGPFLGIDHSALSVSRTAASLRFFRGLGLRRAGQTLNRGPQQAALDGFAGATARVTSLRPGVAASMGLELLGYAPPGRPAPAGQPVGQWTTLDTGRGAPRVLRDPDGHVFVLTA